MTNPQHPTKTIAFVLYPGLTALDLVGPQSILAGLQHFDPAFETVVVAESTDAVTSDSGLTLTAARTFAQVPDPYAVVVPGGMVPTFRAMTDETLLSYLRTAARTAEVVGSVCSGSLILGAAGLLEGRKATSHWWVRDHLAAFGAIPVSERWVEDGPVITSAGVSAGIDMALHLAGRLAGPEVARQIQLVHEYDPMPPFGPIDWETVDFAASRGFADQALKAGLADHPELLARLLATPSSRA